MEERPASQTLTDATRTLLVSLIAYSCAFVYEAGYCAYYRIPFDLVRLDTTRFLVYGFALALLGLAFLPTFTLLYGAGQRIPLGRRPEFNSFLFALGLMLTLAIFMFLASGFKPWPPISVLLGYVVVALPDVIAASRLPDKVPFTERLVMVRRKTVGDAASSISAKVKRQPLILLVSLLYLLSASWQLGNSHARYQTEFLCLDGVPMSVVLRVYGDRIICGQLSEKQRIDKTFRLIDLSKESNILLRRQSVHH